MFLQDQCELGIEPEFWPEEMATAQVIDVAPVAAVELDFAELAFV